MEIYDLLLTRTTVRCGLGEQLEFHDISRWPMDQSLMSSELPNHHLKIFVIERTARRARQMELLRWFEPISIFTTIVQKTKTIGIDGFTGSESGVSA